MARGGGPKKLSVAELEASGSKKWAGIRKRLEKAESQAVPTEFPAKPDRLSPKAAAFWDEIRPSLEVSGGVLEAQATTLERFCEAFVTWRHTQDNPWSDEGGGNGGWVSAVATLDRKLDSLAAQLGLKDRRALVAAKPTEKVGEWFARFAAGGE